VINDFNENEIKSYSAFKKKKEYILLVAEVIIRLDLIHNLHINIRHLQRGGICIYNNYKKLINQIK